MKKIASKAIPLACVITAPFFVNADEQSENSAMLLTANAASTASAPSVAASKLATTNGGAKTQQNTPATPYQPQPTKQITPPAGPNVSNGVDLFITADFIWWKAQQDGLQYAFNGGTGQTGDEPTLNATRGSMHQPHFKYEPGFKVGLGLLCDHDNWDLYAQYTWLNSSTNHKHHNETATASFAGDLMGVDSYENAGANPALASASANWKLHFNVLDVELGRNFWISKRLTMRPHLGMKFSWLKQHYNVTTTDNFVATDTFNYNNKVREFGVGIRAGLDNSYYLANKWSIFGDFAVTGLWNHFKSTREDVYTSAPGATSVDSLDVRFKPHTITTVFELDLGLRFETIFSKGKYMYMLQAAWETQVWFNQGQFVNTNGFSNPANLSLEGLTIKTGFWF